ncbi:hypothetical protein ACSMXN_09400 [Jatrophihabitans sp. DSM 45814]
MPPVNLPPHGYKPIPHLPLPPKTVAHPAAAAAAAIDAPVVASPPVLASTGATPHRVIVVGLILLLAGIVLVGLFWPRRTWENPTRNYTRNTR